MKVLLTVLRHLPLLATAVATFWAQSLLGNISDFEQICLFLLWGALIGGWLYNGWQQRPHSRFPLALPLTICGLTFLYLFDVPVRLIWSINRLAFQQALTRPSLARSQSDAGPRIGMFRALQIGKADDNTRFVLRKVDAIFGLGRGTTSGYAYCPKEDNTAQFPPYGNECNTTQFPRFWKVSEYKTTYYSLGFGWYAWTQSGDDFG